MPCGLHQVETVADATYVRWSVAASSTMRNAVDTVGQVSTLIDGISGSTRHQSLGTLEVKTGVAQLKAMAQQNTALIEQGSAALESLREQARLL